MTRLTLCRFALVRKSVSLPFVRTFLLPSSSINFFAQLISYASSPGASGWRRTLYAAPPPSPVTSISEIGPASCPSPQKSARAASLSSIEVVRLLLKMPSSGSVSSSPILILAFCNSAPSF